MSFCQGRGEGVRGEECDSGVGHTRDVKMKLFAGTFMQEAHGRDEFVLAAIRSA